MARTNDTLSYIKNPFAICFIWLFVFVWIFKAIADAIDVSMRQYRYDKERREKNADN